MSPPPVEWVGGLVALPPVPIPVSDGESQTLHSLVWMGPDGIARGIDVGPRHQLVAEAAKRLPRIFVTLVPNTPLPTRLRVADPDLAEALRAGFPGLDVVCAPTPEIAPVLEAMATGGLPADGLPAGFFDPDTDDRAVAAFFRAAAGFHRAKPWTTIPSDRLVSVTVEAFEAHDLALCVAGGAGEVFGLIVFESPEDFERYVDLGESLSDVDMDDLPDAPSHLSMTFERRADLEPELVALVAEHGWALAGPDAYPCPAMVTRRFDARPPGPGACGLLEAIALAVPQLAAERKALAAAFRGGPPVHRAIPVQTHAGDAVVILAAPYGAKPTPTAANPTSRRTLRNRRKARDRGRR